MILQATNVNDISFRLMDVIMIVGGVGSILVQYFTQKGKIQSICEAFDNYKKITDKEVELLTTELTKMEDKHGDFKDNIFKRLDDQNESIHKLSGQIIELTQILKNRKI